MIKDETRKLAIDLFKSGLWSILSQQVDTIYDPSRHPDSEPVPLIVDKDIFQWQADILVRDGLLEPVGHGYAMTLLGTEVVSYLGARLDLLLEGK
jgi:hypothetical protein